MNIYTEYLYLYIFTIIYITRYNCGNLVSDDDQINEFAIRRITAVIDHDALVDQCERVLRDVDVVLPST